MYRIIGADQQEYGPVSSEGLRQWIADGRANSQTLVQREGETGWQPLGSLPEFAGDLSGQTPGSAGPPMSETPGGYPPHIPNYLVPSILVTICCCLPFGIVAIVYAAQVNSKLEGGNIEGALDASNKARLWCWISFGAGLVGILFYALMAGVSGTL